jgi:serpin B
MTPLTRRSFLAAAGALAAGAGLGCASANPVSPVPPPDPEAGPMINAFAADLYAKLKGSKGNVFFSPFSISAALGMTATGAKGNTLAQMQTVLHLPPEAETVDARFAGLLHALAGPNAGYQLTTANAIWAQKGFPWRDEFKSRVARYGAGLTDADFATQPDKERLAVNAWVEKQTKDKIKELLKSGTVTPDTRMVLANAIYFKGDWLEQFDKKATRPAPFTSTDGTKADAPLMFRKGKFSLYKDDGVQVLSLPYKGNDLSMLVALPTKGDGLPALESTLTPDVVTKWSKGLKETSDLQVYLPKFKVETEYSLGRTLMDMGMKDAFGGAADFGGMHSGPDRLCISLVVHKAYVDVNEEGTEAAAATGVVMTRTSVPVRPNVFRADHPFVFAIRHNASGAVLFLGRVERP